MKKYEVNENTMAVIGLDENSTKVVEKSKEYLIEDIAYSVMEHSCNYFGSSYRGRIEGSKEMIGSKYKTPIIVEESNELIFFPINNIENPKCTWISLKWVDHVKTVRGKTYIYLKNGKRLQINASKYSVENQVLRSSKLHLILNERKSIKK